MRGEKSKEKTGSEKTINIMFYIFIALFFLIALILFAILVRAVTPNDFLEEELNLVEICLADRTMAKYNKGIYENIPKLITKKPCPNGRWVTIQELKDIEGKTDQQILLDVDGIYGLGYDECNEKENKNHEKCK